ncbi:MAG: hypothetical protein PHX93_05045 [Candidatus Peribacteraceae bacterium]|jgi:hypothetical protein|nr:hypothetical protein [Candidatus Peribacteraceae bacterium]
MHKFTLGTLVGISSLVLVPLLASAASSAVGTSENPPQRPVPSQECLQAQVAEQDLLLSTFDATSVARKSAMQAHRDVLAAAAAITDETQRQAALQRAHEDFRTAMKDLMPAGSDEMQAARQAVQDACGGSGHKGGMGLDMGGGFGGGRMMGGFGEHGMRGERRGGPAGPETDAE